MAEFYGFAVTINPTGGTTTEIDETIFGYLSHLKCHYLWSVEVASQRHLHLGVLSPSNSLAKLLRKNLVKHYPNVFTHPKVSVKCKTWYKSTGALVDSNHSSWIDYVSKDGNVSYSPGFPSEYEHYLSDHVDLAARQSSSWPVMNHWLQLFKNHQLPSETEDEIARGLSTLAFKLKVASLPRGSDIPGLIFNIWAYSNSFDGNLMDAMEIFAVKSSLSRKRLRIEIEEEDKEFEKICEEVN